MQGYAKAGINDELISGLRRNQTPERCMHLAFFSAAHTREDVETMLRAFIYSVEGVSDGE